MTVDISKLNKKLASYALSRFTLLDIASLYRNQFGIEIEADKKDMFSPKKDIAVMKIRKTPELMELYERIYKWLKGTGVQYNSPEYQGDGYLPHSTFQKIDSLAQGEKRILRSISLIDLFPNNDGYQRKIFKTIELQ